MKNKIPLCFLIVLVSVMIYPNQSFQEEFKFYGKGHVEPSDPIFGDEFLRLLIKGDKATIIDVVSHYGMVIIRMDLELDESCDNPDLIRCYKGKVSELKNVDHPNVGSEISLIINLQEKIWKLSIHSGNMMGTNVLVFLENIGNTTNENRGNLKIDWSNCSVDFDSESLKPTTVRLYPKVIDNFDGIKQDVKSKFRFSYDNEVNDSSHIHLDYKIIDEHKISPTNPEPIILELQKAIEKAEEQKINQFKVESRHYTIFPPNEEGLVSYNNIDESILNFVYDDGTWLVNQNLCKFN